MAKKYMRDFPVKFSEQCIDLSEGFEIASDISDLMVSNVNVSRETHPSPGRIIDRQPVGYQSDRRVSGMGDDDKWSKSPGPLASGRDPRMDNYGGNFRPGQGENYGGLRNLRAQAPPQYAGGILSGPMQSLGSQGDIQWNTPDSERWQHATTFQKGLIPSPQTPLRVMHKGEKKYEVGKVTDEEQTKQRKLKAILNKRTPQNFGKLFDQVKAVNIDNAVTLTGVVSQIFDKALMEPTFCEMYANLCYHLAGELPDFSEGNERITFKRLLLNKCQEEFERGEREQQEADRADQEGKVKQSEEQTKEKKLEAQRRKLGNIRLIGELYKKKMLTERIMHECIKKLLGQYQNPDEKDIEALCTLMITIGEMIDHPNAKEHMDTYFDMMAKLSNNMTLSSEVRFMLKDAIDLRKNKWQHRRKVEEPKKIEEVHRDAAQERKVQAGRLTRGQSMNNSVRNCQPMDFAPRGSSMLSSPSAQTSSLRVLPPQLRGFGNHDIRLEDRQWNTLHSERWQHATTFQKGLIPSPQTPLQVMHKAGKKYGVGKVTDEEQTKQRQLKAILNKLTPQNFEKLFDQVKAVNIDNAGTLTVVISQIFDKALMEPTFCEMYANVCYHLAGELPDFSEGNERITFKRLLLNKCQEEFERVEREQQEADRADQEGEVKQSEEQREEKRIQARRRMLGNVRLIGELYKTGMLTGRIMHECIQKLLGHYRNPDEGDIEALCTLMSTIGEIIDHPKDKEHMDAYFDMMARLSNNMKLSSGVRFMLKDAIDLRKNKWQQRQKVEGPNQIEEVHRDAAQERKVQAGRLKPLNIALADAPSPGDSRRMATGLNCYTSVSDQAVYGREDLMPRYVQDRLVSPSYEQPSVHDRNVRRGNRDPGITDRSPNRSLPTSPTIRGQGPTFTQNIAADKVWPEDRLQEMSIRAIKEFYSARDEKEVAQCVRDLNSPGFYPTMISIWITESFERKDMERDLLAELLVNLSKSREGMLNQHHLIKGFESVLATLEDAVIDAPKAGEFLGRLLAKIISENVLPFTEIGKLIYEGGEEHGSLVESGLAAEIVGTILETIKSEKGDSVVNEIRTSSSLKLEKFRHPDPKRSRRLDNFI